MSCFAQLTMGNGGLFRSWSYALQDAPHPSFSSKPCCFCSQGGRTLHLIAAVLHLRGEKLCAQPAEDAHGNVLLWNGEVPTVCMQ